jgi:hypothetical protein
LAYTETGNTSTQGASTFTSTKQSFVFGCGNSNFNMLSGSVINISSNNNVVLRAFPSAINCVTIGSIDNPNYTLDVRGAAGNLGVRGNTFLGASGSSASARLHVVGSGSTSTTWTAQFHNASNNNALMVRNDGIVSIGTASPNGSGVLEISSTTRGVLFPRMTTTERNAISSPADGLVIYNTTDNKLQVRAAGAWVDLH